MRRASVSGLIALVGLAVVVGSGTAHAQDAATLLDPVFQDQAVIQRDRPVPVWGRAAPGQAVAVTLGEDARSGVADADGRWRIDMPSQAAGARPALTVRAGAVSRTVSDLAAGDVFLCSGQSNMEFAVRQSTNADVEIAGANDPDLRLFLVARSSLPAPDTSGQAVGRWLPTTPDSVRDFSAACYFMGRDLRRSEGVPIGLIAASWGGSIIEDWLDEASLRRIGGHDVGLDILATYARSPQEGVAALRRFADGWWRDNDPGTRQGWHTADFDDSEWDSVPAEGFWEAAPGLETFDGIIWLRTHVRLTAAQARQAATLELGPVDDMDSTWVNGRFVGGEHGWDLARAYAVPAGTLKAGDNLIAVGVLDSGGGGGAWGPAGGKALVLADGQRIPLGDRFRYREAAPLWAFRTPPRTPWVGGNGLTTLYNGMIAPLGPWGLKGVAWYQGESNIGDPEGYRTLLNGLFANWRARFETPDLAFLIVQLANFGPAATEPVHSGWAELREAQRAVTNADVRTGLAVAVDIGDRYDIHPTNKLEVGRRLALEARRVIHGATVARSPQPQEAHLAGGVLRIAYPAGSRLVTWGSDRVIGLQLCDTQTDCRWSEGRVDGDALVLPAPGAAQRVRFCWGDSPVCNLYGPDGLPAVPFELDVRR